MLTQDDAREIAKKLKAQIKPGRRHDLVLFRHEGKLVGQFGISRASKDHSHDYIPKQLYITPKQCREFQACSLSLEEYLQILSGKQIL